MEYVVQVMPDEPGVLVICQEIPEFASAGDTEAEALAHAPDALETALMIYIEDRRPIPLPRKAKKGEVTVALPAQAQAKALLHNAMLEHGVTKAELRRRLGIHDPQVERLLDMRHASKLEAIEDAADALGLRVELRLLKAKDPQE